MKSFYNLIKTLILEEVSREEIERAIENKKIVTIYYEGPKPIKGWREIEPYAYGLSIKSNPVVRAYQERGATNTESPGWKLFRVDRITTWNEGMAEFSAPREGFNPNGDEKMITVYKIAQF